MQRRGLMLILSSPSGAGKTTLSRRLLDHEQGNGLVMSISVTTRAPRPGEVDGRDYFFVTHEHFLNMVSANAFLEHAKVFENHYGTPAAFVDKQLKQSSDVLFDIDWQGARQISEKAREDVVSIFILPPSLAELERRLKSRAQDSELVVSKRMEKAQSEISHWNEYDYVVVNTSLDATLEKVGTILKAERMKRVRQTQLKDFVRTL